MVRKIPPLSEILQFLTLALLPLYIIRFNLTVGEYLLPSTLLEVLIFVTVIVTAFDFFRDGLPWPKLKTDFDLLIGLFLVASLISLFSIPDLKGGLGVFKAYFVEPILLFYCFFYTASKKGSNYILAGLITAASWLSLLGLLQKVTGQFSLAPHEIVLGRISALYNSANALALFLGPIVFITLAVFFKAKKYRLLFLSLVVFYLATIIWTKSRGGLVGGIVSFVTFGYGMFSLKYKRLQKFWFIIPAGLAIVLTIFFYQTFSIYDSSISQDESRSPDTLQVRFALWSGTAKLLEQHPIFGAGLNGFKTLYSKDYKISPQQEDLQYPHNIFLNFWVETGLAGLIIFLFILARAFKLLIQNLSQKDYYLGLGLICGLTFWLVQGIVDVPYFKNDLSVEFWVVLCLVELWLKQKLA